MNPPFFIRIFVSIAIAAGVIGVGLWVLRDEFFTEEVPRIESHSLENDPVVSSQESSSPFSFHAAEEGGERAGEGGGNHRLRPGSLLAPSRSRING